MLGLVEMALIHQISAGNQIPVLEEQPVLLKHQATSAATLFLIHSEAHVA